MPVVLALMAAVVYGSAVALQQHEAQATERELAMRPRLLLRLARRPLWLAGLACDVGGFGLQAAALTVGSIVLVQPVLTTNLVFGLVLSALLAQGRLSRRQWAAAFAIVVGLVVFLAAAQPTAHSQAVATERDWVTVVAAVGALIAMGLAVGRSARGVRRAIGLGVAAGGAEGIMAVVAKAFGERVGDGVAVALRSWETLAVVGCGGLTLLIVQSAYQVGLPMLVLPVHAVVEPVVGVGIGMGLFHERVHLSGARGPLVVLAIATLGYGLAALGRDPMAHRRDDDTRDREGRHDGSRRPSAVR